MHMRVQKNAPVIWKGTREPLPAVQPLPAKSFRGGTPRSVTSREMRKHCSEIFSLEIPAGHPSSALLRTVRPPVLSLAS